MLEEKLKILTDAAKYDASCSSSGSGRQGKNGFGNAHMAGICHSWSADGRCVSLLKVLMSNACSYDCAYCVNRRSNDVPRASFTPEELASLTAEFYRRNYIEGLFLSSAVVGTPDITMERMIKVIKLLREQYHFYGYIHVKVIPGASPYLIQCVGLLADRLSVNIELPSQRALKQLAPQKEQAGILLPMARIKVLQVENREERKKYRHAPMFAPAGQTTQMIIGATRDTDLSILETSQRLYQKFQLKRVYFSAYIPVGLHPALPGPDRPAPLLREHRLYQADWLMRFYHFDANEILEEGAPALDDQLDPKCAWALRHRDQFPIDINTADYELLLRIPGIGVRSAKRIVSARQFGTLSLEHLPPMGVVIKRAQYFITAQGRFQGRMQPDSPFLRQAMLERQNSDQLSFFDSANPVFSGLHLSDGSVAAVKALLPAGV